MTPNTLAGVFSCSACIEGDRGEGDEEKNLLVTLVSLLLMNSVEI